MPTKKLPAHQAFRTEIEPLWQKLDALLKQHNMCGIAAFSVPVSQNGGAIILYATPSKEGTMPQPFLDAYQAIAGKAHVSPSEPGATPG